MLLIDHLEYRIVLVFILLVLISVIGLADIVSREDIEIRIKDLGCELGALTRLCREVIVKIIDQKTDIKAFVIVHSHPSNIDRIIVSCRSCDPGRTNLYKPQQPLLLLLSIIKEH